MTPDKIKNIAEKHGINLFGKNIFQFSESQLQSFAKAIEADFISRCEHFDTVANNLGEIILLYKLPKD